MWVLYGSQIRVPDKDETKVIIWILIYLKKKHNLLIVPKRRFQHHNVTFTKKLQFRIYYKFVKIKVELNKCKKL